MKTQSGLSIVMPAQDEAARLPSTLLAIAREPACAGAEILVVDDGSRDDTALVAKTAVPGSNVRVLSVPGRRGVGVAVRAGMLAARGSIILLCDADGAVPFQFIDTLKNEIDRGCDVAVGSRRLGRVVVPQPWHRIVMGKVWGRLVRHLAPTGVADSQCGFKLFRREAAQRLFLASRCRTFAFHVELLRNARQLGLAVAEVPVEWHDVPGSKIKVGRDSARMLRELIGLAAERPLPASQRIPHEPLLSARRYAGGQR